MAVYPKSTGNACEDGGVSRSDGLQIREPQCGSGPYQQLREHRAESPHPEGCNLAGIFLCLGPAALGEN